MRAANPSRATISWANLICPVMPASGLPALLTGNEQMLRLDEQSKHAVGVPPGVVCRAGRPSLAGCSPAVLAFVAHSRLGWRISEEGWRETASGGAKSCATGRGIAPPAEISRHRTAHVGPAKRTTRHHFAPPDGYHATRQLSRHRAAHVGPAKRTTRHHFAPPGSSRATGRIPRHQEAAGQLTRHQAAI